MCGSYCGKKKSNRTRLLSSSVSEFRGFLIQVFFLDLLKVLVAPAQTGVSAELPALTQCTFLPDAADESRLHPSCTLLLPSLPPSSVTFFIKSHTGMQGRNRASVSSALLRFSPGFGCSPSALPTFLQMSTDPTPTEECDQQP